MGIELLRDTDFLLNAHMLGTVNEQSLLLPSRLPWLATIHLFITVSQ